MASKRTKKGKKSEQQGEEKQQQQLHPTPWISMNSGLKIIAITSIGMAVLTMWQLIPQIGWLEGILYGLLFGGMIWAIFFGMQLFFKFTRR
ncbi:MAG: hypothetical protein LWX83_03900 [Anaerolineae bacterium]|nr:hypothetical protein [Anaerolineae bacterium]